MHLLDVKLRTDQLQRLAYGPYDFSALTQLGPVFRHVLCLVPDSMVTSIFKIGLQSSGYTKGEFAFTTAHYDLIQAGWERSSYSLLVFLIGVPKCFKRKIGLTGTIPMASVDHPLPLAKVILNKLPQGQLPIHGSIRSS